MYKNFAFFLQHNKLASYGIGKSFTRTLKIYKNADGILSISYF